MLSLFALSMCIWFQVWPLCAAEVNSPPLSSQLYSVRTSWSHTYWYHHGFNLVKASILLQYHVWSFLVIPRRHNLIADFLVPWLLKLLWPSSVMFLSLRNRNCVVWAAIESWLSTDSWPLHMTYCGFLSWSLFSVMRCFFDGHESCTCLWLQGSVL